MHFYIIFFMWIGISIAVEAKTIEECEKTMLVWEKVVEELRQEIDFFKTKFQNIENKMETIETKTQKIAVDQETLETNMNEKNRKNVQMELGVLQQELNSLKIKSENNEELNLFKTKTEEGLESNEVKMRTFETKLESCEMHFDQVDEDIEAIKSEIEMHSSFCGYIGYVQSTGTVTYESLLFESNNIPEASFNLESGRFTAGAPGTYRLDLSIGNMLSSSSSSPNDIYIQRNGENIDESNIFSQIYTTGSLPSHESGGRSMLIYLEKDDFITVSVYSVYQISFTTFCVSYVSA